MKKILSLPCLIDLLAFAVVVFLGHHCYKMAEQHRYVAALGTLYWLIGLTSVFLFFLRRLFRA